MPTLYALRGAVSLFISAQMIPIMKKKYPRIRKYDSKGKYNLQSARILYYVTHDGRYTLFGTWRHHDYLFDPTKVYTLVIETRGGHITLLSPMQRPYYNFRPFLEDWHILLKPDYLEKLIEEDKRKEEAKNNVSLPFKFKL